MKLKLQQRIDIVAVEIPPVYEFSQQLSDKVKKAVPKAVKTVKQLVKP